MTTTTDKPTTFEIGETYYCQSACNSDTIFEWTVIGRTVKTITVLDDSGDTKRRGVKVDDDGIEWAMPDGSYSMAPVIRADRRYEPPADDELDQGDDEPDTDPAGDDELDEPTEADRVRSNIDHIERTYRGALVGKSFPDSLIAEGSPKALDALVEHAESWHDGSIGAAWRWLRADLTVAEAIAWLEADEPATQPELADEPEPTFEQIADDECTYCGQHRDDTPVTRTPEEWHDSAECVAANEGDPAPTFVAGSRRLAIKRAAGLVTTDSIEPGDVIELPAQYVTDAGTTAPGSYRFVVTFVGDRRPGSGYTVAIDGYIDAGPGDIVSRFLRPDTDFALVEIERFDRVPNPAELHDDELVLGDVTELEGPTDFELSPAAARKLRDFAGDDELVLVKASDIEKLVATARRSEWPAGEVDVNVIPFDFDE